MRIDLNKEISKDDIGIVAGGILGGGSTVVAEAYRGAAIGKRGARAPVRARNIALEGESASFYALTSHSAEHEVSMHCPRHVQLHPRRHAQSPGKQGEIHRRPRR